MSYFSLRANFAIKICLNKKKTLLNVSQSVGLYVTGQS